MSDASMSNKLDLTQLSGKQHNAVWLVCWPEFLTGILHGDSI